MELLIGQLEGDGLGHVTSVRRQFYTFLGAGRARRASQRDGMRRDAVPLGEARQPLLREAPAPVERAMYANEVFFRVLWFAGEPLHRLARFEGDVCCLDAERVGCGCCGQGCQEMHGCCTSAPSFASLRCSEGPWLCLCSPSDDAQSPLWQQEHREPVRLVCLLTLGIAGHC